MYIFCFFCTVACTRSPVSITGQPYQVNGGKGTNYLPTPILLLETVCGPHVHSSTRRRIDWLLDHLIMAEPTKFTMDESNGSLSFLDTLVTHRDNRPLSKSVYRKKTQSRRPIVGLHLPLPTTSGRLLHGKNLDELGQQDLYVHNKGIAIPL